jgi:hypothetical protein
MNSSEDPLLIGFAYLFLALQLWSIYFSHDCFFWLLAASADRLAVWLDELNYNKSWAPHRYPLVTCFAQAANVANPSPQDLGAGTWADDPSAFLSLPWSLPFMKYAFYDVSMNVLAAGRSSSIYMLEDDDQPDQNC